MAKERLFRTLRPRPPPQPCLGGLSLALKGSQVSDRLESWLVWREGPSQAPNFQGEIFLTIYSGIQ